MKTDVLEAFFGAKFERQSEELLEMRFESCGMKYCVWVWQDIFSLIGDPHSAKPGFPAIEIACECRHIKETEASGVGPVLMLYAGEEERRERLRLCITRTGDGCFSISPHWQMLKPIEDQR